MPITGNYRKNKQVVSSSWLFLEYQLSLIDIESTHQCHQFSHSSLSSSHVQLVDAPNLLFVSKWKLFATCFNCPTCKLLTAKRAKMGRTGLNGWLDLGIAAPATRKKKKNSSYLFKQIYIYTGISERCLAQLETIYRAKTIWLSCVSATETAPFAGLLFYFVPRPPATPPLYGSLHQQLF